MRRIEPQLVGDVLRQIIEESDMLHRLDEFKAIDAWKPVVGEHIASLTARPYVNNGVMIIAVSSAPLRNELTMNRATRVSLINERVGRPAIKDIRFK